MKRFIALLMMSFCVVAIAFADASFTGSGTPSVRENPELTHTFFFSYDPKTVERLTFGFTDHTDLSWNNSSEDYGEKLLSLKTAYVRDNITYGYGNINFYWKLKTNNNIEASLYLEGPLMDPSTGIELDWSLEFLPQGDNEIYKSTANVNSYGLDNGKTIYTKIPGKSDEVQIGYVPVKIKTAESNPSVGDQNYIGTVGVLVKIS